MEPGVPCWVLIHPKKGGWKMVDYKFKGSKGDNDWMKKTTHYGVYWLGTIKDKPQEDSWKVLVEYEDYSP